MTQLFPIPPDWTWMELATTADYIQRGKSPKYADKSEMIVINQKCVRWGELKLTHARNIASEQIGSWNEERLLRHGDLLWNSTGTGTIGRACIFYEKENTTKYVVDSHVTIVRVNQKILPEFLFYWVSSPFVQNRFESLQTGSTNQVELSRKAVLELKLPVPPLNIQHEIVERISSLFSEINQGINCLKNIEDKLEIYKQSILNAAIRGKLVPQDPNDEPASVLLERIRDEKKALIAAGKLKKEKPLAPITADEIPFELPEGWEWVRLNELVKSGPTNGIYLPQSKYGSGTPILRIDDFQNDWCRPSNSLRKANATPAQIEAYSLKMGDIVINRVNSMSHLGKCIVISDENIPSIFESNMMSCRFFSDIEPLYISAWLQSRIGHSILTQNAKHAVNQASINQQDVLTTLVPLPPKTEQRAIINDIAFLKLSIKTISKSVENHLRNSEFLKKTILKSAFEGNLL